MALVLGLIGIKPPTEEQKLVLVDIFQKGKLVPLDKIKTTLIFDNEKSPNIFQGYLILVEGSKLCLTNRHQIYELSDIIVYCMDERYVDVNHLVSTTKKFLVFIRQDGVVQFAMPSENLHFKT